MGHGASTQVKKVTIGKAVINGVPTKSDEHSGISASATLQCALSTTKVGWTRSNSDGCIVESLTTSKTKVEFLEQQLDESKELLHQSEQRCSDASVKAGQLEKQMADVEGANFELLDIVSELEQQIKELKEQTSPESQEDFTQTLLEQSQIIERQEDEIKTLVAGIAKMHVKLRKKLHSAKTELAEVKQEAGLRVYTLKDEMAKLRSENTILTERLSRVQQSSRLHGQSGPTSNSSDTTPNHGDDIHDGHGHDQLEDGRTKVILELSSQVSAQDQRISELEEFIKDKDRMITSLQRTANQQPPVELNPRPSSGSNPRPPSGSNPRPPSGSNPRPLSGSNPHPSSGSNPRTSSGSNPRTSSGSNPRPSSGSNPRPSSGSNPRPSGSNPQPPSGFNPRPSTGSNPQPPSGSNPRPSSGSNPQPPSGSNPRPSSGSNPQPDKRMNASQEWINCSEETHQKQRSSSASMAAVRKAPHRSSSVSSQEGLQQHDSHIYDEDNLAKHQSRDAGSVSNRNIQPSLLNSTDYNDAKNSVSTSSVSSSQQRRRKKQQKSRQSSVKVRKDCDSHGISEGINSGIDQGLSLR